ncbi:MAG: WYL domain-containing protein [Bacteroides sp.]|nr:WYL domain-containing protein [Bacteroides sp.]
MATSVRLLRRYVWLVDTVRRAKHITFEEIKEQWLNEKSIRMEKEKELPERTFHRHREAIADLFGIDILCNRFNGNTYYIDNEDALNKPTFTAWLFNGLSLDNRLMENEEVADRILFDETPGGSEHMATVATALTENRILKIVHKRFNKSKGTENIVEPYGMKQTGRRWYLVGKPQGSDRLLVFALDRIDSIELTDKTFKLDEAIDIRSYFDDVVGVNVDEDFDCEKVVVRIYGTQCAYVDALPIHKSQKIIKSTKEYCDYQYKVRPEYEFQHEILRLGAAAEVISPKWLREEFIWMADEIRNRYNKSNS